MAEPIAGVRALGRFGPADLWLADLDAAPVEMQGLLCAAEVAEAGRFGNPRLRRLYVARRQVLHLLLAARTGTAPDRVVIRREPHGKPTWPGSHVRFSLARSGTWALYGLADEVAIGVDLQSIDHGVDWRTLDRSPLSTQERTRLGALGREASNAEFTRCWAHKEACAKALGVGLGADLASFVVPGRGGVQANAVRSMDVPVEDGQVAALAWVGSRPSERE